MSDLPAFDPGTIATYLMFPPDVDPEQARQVFVQRFGHEPEVVEVYKLNLWVGPAVQEKEWR